MCSVRHLHAYVMCMLKVNVRPIIATSARGNAKTITNKIYIFIMNRRQSVNMCVCV